MTRDEHRAKCIEAMARTMCRQFFAGLHGVTRFGPPETLRKGLEIDIENHWREWIEKATEVFDSLHDITRVVPAEATNEMIIAVVGEAGADCSEIYLAMSAAGRLTNPPEKKP